MSRYKKAILGEMELPEINGVSFLIYPTLEHRMRVLEIFKNAQRTIEVTVKGQVQKIQGDLNLEDMKEVCLEIIEEGCFNHDEKGVRLSIKEEEKGTTREDILYTLMECGIVKVYQEIAVALKVITVEQKDKIEEENSKNSESSPEES